MTSVASRMKSVEATIPCEVPVNVIARPNPTPPHSTEIGQSQVTVASAWQSQVSDSDSRKSVACPAGACFSRHTSSTSWRLAGASMVKIAPSRTMSILVITCYYRLWLWLAACHVNMLKMLKFCVTCSCKCCALKAGTSISTRPEENPPLLQSQWFQRGLPLICIDNAELT